MKRVKVWHDKVQQLVIKKANEHDGALFVGSEIDQFDTKPKQSTKIVVHQKSTYGGRKKSIRKFQK